jgi:hypothetical protein
MTLRMFTLKHRNITLNTMISEHGEYGFSIGKNEVNREYSRENPSRRASLPIAATDPAGRAFCFLRILNENFGK